MSKGSKSRTKNFQKFRENFEQIFKPKQKEKKKKTSFFSLAVALVLGRRILPSSSFFRLFVFVKKAHGHGADGDHHLVARVPEARDRDSGPGAQPARDDLDVARAKVGEDFLHLVRVDALRVRDADLHVEDQVVVPARDEPADRRDGVELDRVARGADCCLGRVLAVAVAAKAFLVFLYLLLLRESGEVREQSLSLP